MTKKTIVFIGIIVFIFLGSLGGFFLLKTTPSEDALRFKNEYEALNGTIRESDGATYNIVSISKNNPIQYIDAKGAIDILESDKAILYIGADWCPWCRNAVPVLFEVAKKYSVSTIYYLDLDDEKDSFEIQDGNLVKTKEGSVGYYELLNKLSNHLNDYVLKDSNGKEYNTNEKRIYLPSVYAIKTGEVVGNHVGTTTLNEGQTKYDAMTEEQHDKVFNIYSELFQKVYK